MGGEGRQAQDITGQRQSGVQALGGRTAAASDPRVAAALAQYGTGGLGLQEAMQQARGAAGPAAKAAREASANQQVDQQIEQALASAPPQVRDQLRQQMQAQRGQMLQNQLAKMPDDSGAAESSIADLITTNPLAAERYAKDTVMQGEDTARLFGKGGELDRSQASTEEFMGQGRKADEYADLLQQEERDLAGRGYSLQPEDYEAYGQMSDELARTFGAQEKGAAASLAARGLSAGPSGQAGALFSGLQGNKNEQLAKAQRNVAQARMDTNMKRLDSQRQFLGQQQNQAQGRYGLGLQSRGQTTALGGLQEQAKQNVFGRAMGGRQQSASEAAAAAGQQLNQLGMQQGQANTAFDQQEATRGPSFGEVLGGVGSSVLGAATGGIGKAVGGAVGGLFGSKPKEPVK
jgi:hypothetical protein